MTVTASQIYDYATKAGAKWPELVAAQWQLESEGGKYLSGANNPFGLKGPGKVVETTEYVNSAPTKIQDAFINFDSQSSAVNYLVERWYKDWRNYRGVNNAANRNDAARMLQSEGYATDPRYAAKLIDIMSRLPQQESLADLVDVVRFFRNEPHQVQALRNLQTSLSIEQRRKFTQDWRSGPQPPTAAKFPLVVPYHAQTDSRTSQALRMCQSSAIAMRLHQIAPSVVSCDDDYLQVVNRYGDTVSQSAHQKALEHLGFKASFRQNGSEATLRGLLDQDVAVPIGILHRGHISAPSGGGHWVTLIGYDDQDFMVHDPMGRMDMIRGGYTDTKVGSGRNVRYDRKSLMRRWLIDGSGSDGWYWEIRR